MKRITKFLWYLFLLAIFYNLFANPSTGSISKDVEPSGILIISGNGNSLHITDTDQIPQGNWDLIIFQDAPDTIIENIIYEGSTILLIRSDNTVIRNNTLNSPNSYAIFVEFSDNVKILNNTIKNGNNEGIITYGNSNVLVDGNIILNVVKNGIFAVGSNTTISNNYIDGVVGTGIFLQNGNNMTIVNNSISNVDWSPIATDQSTFDNGYFEMNTYNGILLTTDNIDPSVAEPIDSSIEETPIVSDITDSSATSSSVTSDSTSSNDDSIFPNNIFYITIIIPVLAKKFLTSGKNQF